MPPSQNRATRPHAPPAIGPSAISRQRGTPPGTVGAVDVHDVEAGARRLDNRPDFVERIRLAWRGEHREAGAIW